MWNCSPQRYPLERVSQISSRFGLSLKPKANIALPKSRKAIYRQAAAGNQVSRRAGGQETDAIDMQARCAGDDQPVSQPREGCAHVALVKRGVAN
jgi:hypothetical protein